MVSRRAAGLAAVAGDSVAAQPLACLFVRLVGEHAFVAQVPELFELLGDIGWIRWRWSSTPAGEPVGIDPEFAQPGTHARYADAARGEAVSLGAPERAFLNEATIRGDQADRRPQLEHQRHKGMA